MSLSSSLSCLRQHSRVSRRRNSFQCKDLRRQRRDLTLLAPHASANAEKIETPSPDPTAPAAPAPTENKDFKLAQRTADWKKAESLKKTGTVHQGRVDACSSGGLLMSIGSSLQGFLPFSHSSGTRLPKDRSKTISKIGNELVGGLISVKVIEVVEADRRLIVSEKQGGDMYGQTTGSIKLEQVTTGVWDFLFQDGPFPDTKISPDLLKVYLHLLVPKLRFEAPIWGTIRGITSSQREFG